MVVYNIMKLNRQTKSWLLIALIHAGVIYAFSRVDAIELARTTVTATVVTSEQQAATDGVQSPSEVNKATDTQTTMMQKTLARTSHQTSDRNTATQPMSDDGLRNAQTNAALATPLTNTGTLTESLNTAFNDKAHDPASSAFTAPTHIGGHLHNPEPPYPVLSNDAREQGVVTLNVMVEANGQPSSVDVVKSSGYSRLDRSARDTVLNQYRFTPAMQGGQAIRHRYRFDIRFNLKKLESS